jgi:hypothetical protein
MGGKNVTIDQFVSNQAGLPTHQHGRARQLLENEMIPQGEGSIAKYGGQRNAIHLTDVDEAVQYLIRSFVISFVTGVHISASAALKTVF